MTFEDQLAKKIIIIGSGLAGVSAALAAKSQGSEVTLVTGRPGATAMASGAWDIAGYGKEWFYKDHERLQSPKEMIQHIAKSYSHHPYAIMSRDLGSKSLVETMEASIKALVEAMPYKPQGSLNEKMALITPIGSVKYTTLADPAQGEGNILRWRRARLLIAGIPGLASFPISLIQKVLTSLIPKLTERTIETITAAWIDMKGIPQHSLSPFALAKRLEEDAQTSFIESLKEIVRHNRSTHVLLPPVVGLEKSPELIQRISEEVGAVCFESLATVPSVPGLRRYRALERVLEEYKINVSPGVVSRYESVNNTVTKITLSSGDEERFFDIDHVILATGRFIGGGIVKKAEMKESLFDLPVFNRDVCVSDTFIGNLVQRRYLGDHDLFEIGLRVDHNMKPLNRWGKPVFENLYAAGSLLGGYQAAADGTGTGVALLSGWIAGRKGGT